MSRILQVTSPVPTDVWQEVFDRDPDASPFQSPRWMSVVTSNPHYSDQSRLYTTERGRLVLPVSVVRRLPGLASAASLPHGLGAAGLLSDCGVDAEDVGAVVGDVETLGYARVSVRPNAVQAPAWADLGVPGWTRETKTTHILNLREGFDAVWRKRFTGPKRNRVSKALRSGLRVEYGNDPEFVRRFFGLYLRWAENRARARNLPVGPLRWIAARRDPLWKFEAAAALMGDHCRIYIASAEEKTVAGAVLLLGGPSSVYWRGASDTDLLKQFPGNDLLQYEMMKDSCELGCSSYHMGESGGVESLMRFKEQFGALPLEYTEYVKDRLPGGSVLSRLYR